MADYAAFIADDGNGAFYIKALNRGTTTSTFSAGTNLLTDTFTVTSSTGALATASGFLVTTNETGISSSDPFLRKLRTVGEALTKCGEICNNDRSFNG